jgi:hypothetical protein
MTSRVHRPTSASEPPPRPNAAQARPGCCAATAWRSGHRPQGSGFIGSNIRWRRRLETRGSLETSRNDTTFGLLSPRPARGRHPGPPAGHPGRPRVGGRASRPSHDVTKGQLGLRRSARQKQRQARSRRARTTPAQLLLDPASQRDQGQHDQGGSSQRSSRPHPLPRPTRLHGNGRPAARAAGAKHAATDGSPCRSGCG